MSYNGQMDGWMDGGLNLRSIRFSKFLANYRFALNWLTVIILFHVGALL